MIAAQSPLHCSAEAVEEEEEAEEMPVSALHRTMTSQQENQLKMFSLSSLQVGFQLTAEKFFYFTLLIILTNLAACGLGLVVRG